jgi:hypothetical protein
MGLALPPTAVPKSVAAESENEADWTNPDWIG